MSTLMHIDKNRTITGRMRTQCGKVLAYGEGAPSPHAPLCPICQRAAGWGHQRPTHTLRSRPCTPERTSQP